MDVSNKDPIIVFFGGEARELWTGDGLRIAWSGRLAVLAERDGEGRWKAAAPEPARTGDVKSDYSTTMKERELAALLNSGSAPPLTAAYFTAAAQAAEALRLCGDDPRELPRGLSMPLYGGFEALISLELLRLLLDEYALPWDSAAALIAQCFTYQTEKRGRAPLSAIAALCPRLSRLAETVGDKLHETLRRVFPGDRQRLACAAAISDGEVDFGKLCAALCGKIICPIDKMVDEFRTFYVAMPDRFEELI